MLTFDFCGQLVAKGRLNPHVGKRFRSATWVRYDKLNDRYIISEAWPGYLYDPQTRTGTTDWNTAHIDDWAYVYKDRTEIFGCPGHIDVIYAFGVAYGDPGTNKIKGTKWSYNGQIVYGRLPVTITDGKITAHGRALQRHVDPDKYKLYQTHVKDVMNILTTRVKLGVWDNSSFTTPRNTYHRIDIEHFWRILCSVNESDLETVERFIEMVHDVSDVRNTYTPGSMASIRLAKNFFARFKDRFLEHLGALEYR